MLRDVISVEAIGGARLRVRFDDGVEGVVDVAELVPFNGVFEPLRDADFFARATVHPRLGTVCWPNEADLDSDVLYAYVTGEPIPDQLHAKR